MHFSDFFFFLGSMRPSIEVQVTAMMATFIFIFLHICAKKHKWPFTATAVLLTTCNSNHIRKVDPHCAVVSFHFYNDCWSTRCCGSRVSIFFVNVYLYWGNKHGVGFYIHDICAGHDISCASLKSWLNHKRIAVQFDAWYCSSIDAWTDLIKMNAT